MYELLKLLLLPERSQVAFYKTFALNLIIIRARLFIKYFAFFCPRFFAEKIAKNRLKNAPIIGKIDTVLRRNQIIVFFNTEIFVKTTETYNNLGVRVQICKQK